jgi:hypothetical protein
MVVIYETMVAVVGQNVLRSGEPEHVLRAAAATLA